MCGVAGCASVAGPVSSERVAAICAAQVHRGPDSRGLHVADEIGLGIQRLAVIDLERGDQPVYNEDRSVVVVLNGEIYNFRALREELRARGHRFATGSDTEVIVHLYEELGDRLVERLASSPEVLVRVDARVETGWYRSQLPEVRIPGRGPGDLFLLVGGHYCAWDVGITDNATGDACLIELARLLWPARGSLGRSVRICWWPGHSHGRYSGSTWYADTFFRELASSALAYYNIDSPGVKGATRYHCRNTSAELEAYCRRVIADVTSQADPPVSRPARAADQSFLASGVPSFSAYPFLPDDHPDRRPWTGGSASAWWWHTEFDTLDKADVTILATDVQVALTAIWHMTNDDLLPFDYRRTVRELTDIVTPLATAVGGHLDLQSVLQAAAVVSRQLEDFEAARPRVTGDEEETGTWNTAALRLGRLLNPIMFTRGGRFQHDPAEWSPMLRATRRYTLPALARADLLPSLAGSFEYGFLRTQLVREVNRLVATLEATSALLEDALRALPPSSPILP